MLGDDVKIDGSLLDLIDGLCVGRKVSLKVGGAENLFVGEIEGFVE